MTFQIRVALFGVLAFVSVAAPPVLRAARDVSPDGTVMEIASIRDIPLYAL